MQGRAAASAAAMTWSTPAATSNRYRRWPQPLMAWPRCFLRAPVQLNVLCNHSMY